MRFTVVAPVHNEEAMLRQTLGSVFALGPDRARATRRRISWVRISRVLSRLGFVVFFPLIYLALLFEFWHDEDLEDY